jgi:prephenate dehydrogenase
MKQAVIIGVGLIGGSLALDLRRLFPEIEIVGTDLSETNLQIAIDRKLIDRVAVEKDYPSADLIIVAVPVNETCRLLPSLLDKCGENTLIMDVGSTKANICKTVKSHPRRTQFLASHPIAGTEFSGPAAAIYSLFQGKSQILCESENTRKDLLENIIKVFNQLGMRVLFMNPKDHDKHIAYVSHLSHISSFMLGKTVLEIEKNEKNIFDMAGSGFGSTVRLAKSSPAMWTPIFVQNKKNVLTALDEYILNLQEFRKMIADENADGIFQDMQDTNHIREVLKGIYNEV